MSKKKVFYIGTLIIALCVILTGIIVTNKNKQASELVSIQTSINKKQKEILHITDDNTILMSAVSARIATNSKGGQTYISLNTEQEDYTNAKSFDEKIGIWKTMESGFNEVVSAAQMNDANLIIQGSNLKEINKNYLAKTKVNKLLKQLNSLEDRKNSVKHKKMLTFN